MGVGLVVLVGAPWLGNGEVVIVGGVSSDKSGGGVAPSTSSPLMWLSGFLRCYRVLLGFYGQI